MKIITDSVFLLIGVVAFFERCSSLPTLSTSISAAKDIRRKLEGFKAIVEIFKTSYAAVRFNNRPSLLLRLESEFVYPIPEYISSVESVERLIQNASVTHRLAYKELSRMEKILHEITIEERANENKFIDTFNIQKIQLESSMLSIRDAVFGAGFSLDVTYFELPFEFSESLKKDTSRDDRYKRSYKTIKDVHNLVAKLHAVYDCLVKTLESE